MTLRGPVDQVEPLTNHPGGGRNQVEQNRSGSPPVPPIWTLFSRISPGSPQLWHLTGIGGPSHGPPWTTSSTALRLGAIGRGPFVECHGQQHE